MKRCLTLCFDIDGLLAKFTHCACRIHGLPVSAGLSGAWNFHHPHGITDEQFYAPMNREFWAGLGRWEDGFALLRYAETLVGHDNICFITSPAETEGCREGKADWFKKHLPQYKHHADLFIGGAKWKLAGPNKVLLDDSDSNIKKFADAGGKTWLVPRPWNLNRDYCNPHDGTFAEAQECKAFGEWLEGSL